METKLTREQMEARRLLAGRLLLQGKGVSQVAREVGAAKSSVSRWNTALEKGGLEALRAKKAPGATPRLTARQKERLVRILVRGPRKSGYRTELWTCPRVAAVIERVFEVKYHPAHVWKILHDQLGWTCQMPEYQAREKDDEAVQRWREEDWPRIKKGDATKS
jgi:transposase